MLNSLHQVSYEILILQKSTPLIYFSLPNLLKRIPIETVNMTDTELNIKY